MSRSNSGRVPGKIPGSRVYREKQTAVEHDRYSDQPSDDGPDSEQETEQEPRPLFILCDYRAVYSVAWPAHAIMRKHLRPMKMPFLALPSPDAISARTIKWTTSSNLVWRLAGLRSFEVFLLCARSALRQNLFASRSTIASRRSWCGFGKAGRNLGIPKSSVCPNHSSFSFEDRSTASAHFMAR